MKKNQHFRILKPYHRLTSHWLRGFRSRLARVDTLPQLVLLGLVSGVITGGVIGIYLNTMSPLYAASASFYVMLGMAAMMGACLNAPLAALMAVVEMKGNTNIVLPALLIIVTANLVRTEIFKQKSVFETALNPTGTESEQNPIHQVLQRTAVSGIMHQGIRFVVNNISKGETKELLAKNTNWIITSTANNNKVVFNTAELVQYLEHHTDKTEKTEKIELLSLPSSMRQHTQSISIRATLAEALKILNTPSIDAVIVERSAAPLRSPVMGIVHRNDITMYCQLLPKTS